MFGRLLRKERTTLVYNGKSYVLAKGDIPNLNGSGRIVVTRKPNRQEQYVDGNFSNVSMSQNGDRSYINGVDLDELVKKLESRGAR